MSPIHEVSLSLNDVEELIRALEDKYKLSSAEFFRSQEFREGMPEDDVFRWEALVDHRLALREAYEQVRSGYLTRLSQTGEMGTNVETQELLAA